MRLSTRILATLATGALATASLAALGHDRHADLGSARLVAQTAVAAAQGEIIALYLSGRVGTERVDQTTDAWTGDLVSLATGEVAGTLRHEITCREITSFPCMVFTSTDTFDLVGGTIVARGTESIAPYLDAPPLVFHVGINPQGNSITSATGAYAGRTGRAQLMAVHDGREYPGHVTFDDVWLIRLDPAG